MAKYLDTTGVSHLGGKIDERITKRMGLYVVPHGAVSWDTSTAFSMDVSISNNELLGYMDNARLLVVIEKPNNEEATLFEYQRDGDTGDVYLKSTLDADNTYMYANLHLDDTYATIDGEIRSDIADALTELDNKANNDGSYEGMTVGNAERLVSSVGITDETPYNFRTSGGSTEIGDREELNAVVGGTVAWNQLIQDGNFPNTDKWNVVGNSSLSASNNVLNVHRDSGTAIVGGVNIGSSYRKTSIVGHKYLFAFTVQSEIGNQIALFPTGTSSDGNKGYLQYLNKTKIYWLWNCQVSKPISGEIRGYTGDGVTSAINFTLENYMFFDLTAMFGSTIADYVYALEQSNAGAGVAYFRKLFPKPYYAYNAGQLMSVKTSAHKTNGFNQWDEEWERGGLPNGVPDSTVNKIRSKNYCRCVENTVYYGRIGGTYSLTAWFYDANNNVIGSASASNRTFTTPNSACYFKLASESGYGTTYNHDICINPSWDGERDGEYEPYEAHEYALSDITLRGILKLDANNNLYADGDTYAPDGTVERRYGVVDLGTLNWTLNSSYTHNTFYSDYLRENSLVYTTTASIATAICPKYVQLVGNVNAATVGNNVTDKIFCIASSGAAGRIAFADDSYSDAATFKTAMDGVYLVYKLATPTNETASPYQRTQIVDDFGTEEFVDAAVEANERDVVVPVGHTTFYQANLKAKLEMMPNSPDGAGDYIMRSDGSEQTWVPLIEVKELPDVPTTDGTYVLKCTVSDGTATLTWVSE